MTQTAAAASGATGYQVWRGLTPYFAPGAAGSFRVTTTTATRYVDAGMIGDPALNHYYLILATGAAGCPIGVSQRLGEFDFALVPGTALNVAAVRAFEAQIEAQAQQLNLNLNLSLVDTPIASFAYDADGRRIQATVNGVTTIYPFPHYEVEGNTVRKYYFLGGQRVAMRTNGTLSYLLTDHLNSASVSTDASGVKTSSSGFLPFGAERYATDIIPSPYRFTGEHFDAATGLMWIGSRWYDPHLGRWSQPDTLVPDTRRSAGAQSLQLDAE